MPARTPLLDQLRTGKKQSDAILQPVVDKWLVEHGDTLSAYDESDWSALRDLMTRGPRRRRRVFSPSAATLCRRRLVIDKYRDLRPIPLKDARYSKIFDDGRWRHFRWQMTFFKMGIVESMEIFHTLGDLEYGGSYDVVARLMINGKMRRVLIDIKGVHASKFNGIQFSGKPEESNRVQVCIYMHLNNIKIGILWYENKNTQETCEIVIRRDATYHRIIRRYIRRQKYMRRYVEAGAFPKEECDVSGRSNEFQRCPQRNNCLCLPVQLVLEDGEVVKVGEPRRNSKEKRFLRRNTLPLSELEGFRGARKVHSKI